MDNNQNVPNYGQNNPQVDNINTMASATIIPTNENTMVNFQNQQSTTNNNNPPQYNNQNAFGAIDNIGQNNVLATNQQVITNINNHPELDPNTPVVNQADSQTYLNDMNVNGAYNKMEAPIYVNDQKVVENMQGPKKNTITITKELKTIIIISLILLVFIFVMPNIFDLINNFRFR